MKKTALLLLFLLMTGVIFWLALRPESALQTMPEMIHFSPDEIVSLSLQREGAEEISLLRTAGQWQLLGDEPTLAAEEAVFRLLDDLADMEIVRVVTRNPEQYETMGVGTGSTRVILKREGGESALDLLIGKQGTDLVSTYLRIVDEPEVLAVNRALLWQVRRARQGWMAVADDVDTAGVDAVGTDAVKNADAQTGEALPDE